MINLYSKFFSTSILAISFFSSDGFALEVIVVDPGPNVRKVNFQAVGVAQNKRKYPIATSRDVFCGMRNHMVRFRLNANHAGLPFSITADKMTRVTVRWDHPDKVHFPSPEKRKTIVFPHAGGLSSMYFRAHQPISGNVYIINDNGAVIKTCPYRFLPAKRVRQSVSVNVGQSENESSIGNDSESRNISINYNMSRTYALTAL